VADTAKVTVVADDAELMVALWHNGDVGAGNAVGEWPAGLRDRVAAFDGTLQVVSQPDRGTTISARFPLKR
jgi:signal transduction histidine kinase